MALLEYIIAGLGTLFMAVFGFLINRNAKLNDRQNIQLQKEFIQLEKEVDYIRAHTMSKREIRELLDLKLETLYLRLKRDLEELKKD